MPTIFDALRETPILPENEPSELFHYTTGEGLLGILTTRTLWATEVTYLNDASEFRYADELINEAIEQLDIYNAPVWKDRFLSDAISESLACHVACFCEDGDLLSQWRAYGRDGTGYAIGFDMRKLHALNKADRSYLGCVIYDKNTQMSIIENLLKKAFKQLIGTGLKNQIDIADGMVSVSREDAERISETVERIDPVLGPALTEAMRGIVGVRAFLKFPRFAEEREWRLVSFRPFRRLKRDNLLFGVSRGMLVPRMTFNLGESLPITRIIVGPSLHPGEAGRSVRRLLKSLGLESIEVTSSPIPLRA